MNLSLGGCTEIISVYSMQCLNSSYISLQQVLSNAIVHKTDFFYGWEHIILQENGMLPGLARRSSWWDHGIGTASEPHKESYTPALPRPLCRTPQGSSTWFRYEHCERSHVAEHSWIVCTSQSSYFFARSHSSKSVAMLTYLIILKNKCFMTVFIIFH